MTAWLPSWLKIFYIYFSEYIERISSAITFHRLHRRICLIFLNASVLIFFAAVSTPSVLANNVSIENVELVELDEDEDTVIIEFDLSWSNAWRDGTNNDAVWIFAKYSTDAGSTWTHATLKTSGTNPANFDDGVKQSGSNFTRLDLIVSSDKTGCIIEPANIGSGLVDFHNVQLVWDYGENGVTDSEADHADTRIRVYGIEMINIPEGDFDLGDGTGSSESTLAFHVANNTATSVTAALRATVTVDTSANDDIDTTPIGIDGDGGIDVDNSGSIDNADYPTGYKSFYLMKYEISQGQYRDFLNTLTQAQQNSRTQADLSNENDANTYVMVAEGQGTVSNRQTIKAGSNPADGEPYTFGCDLDDDDVLDESNDGEWIAMNYLNWMDVAAFCDWSALRPMTELEYEKAARGENPPVVGEYAWGTTGLTQATGPTNSGQANETSTATGNGLANYNSGVVGPMRVGFSATASTNRVQSGASYYGVMGLSGNLEDGVVTIGNSTGRAFRGTHGDGNLLTTSGFEGNAHNSDWPGFVSGQGVSGATGSGHRGGYWFSTLPQSVSDRTSASVSVTSRSDGYGGRCARTTT